MLASSGGWVQSLEAGAYPAGCYNNVTGNYVLTTCKPGTSGFQIDDELSGQCGPPGAGDFCQNPRSSGGLTCRMSNYTVECSATGIAAGGYSGVASVDLYTYANPPVYIGTESHAWTAQINPNTVSSPGSGGVFPAPNRSCESCLSNTGAPVNIVTGELWYRHTDAALSGPFGLTFTRFYTAQTTYSADLGNNWRHTWDANLDVSQLGNGIVTAYDNENTYQVFFGVATGASSYDLGSGATLALSSDGSTYTLTTFSGMVSKFDSSGRLTSLQDRIGNTQTIARDSSHNYRITSITDVLGRSLSFGYDASNRITSVSSTPSGISMTLSYGGTGCGSNDLCSVTESDGKTWNYQYDTANPSFPHNLTKVTDPNGNTEEVNVFQSSQNVIQEQYIGLDSQSNKIGDLRFTYNLGSTTVYDSVNRSTSYSYDTQNHVTKVAGALCNCGGDQGPAFAYDAYNRLLSVTDFAGNKTTFSYGRDGHGSDGIITYAYPGPTQIVEPLTSSTTRTWNITYYSAGDPRQDLPQTITYPSSDTTGNTDTVTNTFSNTGLLTSQAVQGYINGTTTTYTTSATYDSRGRVQQITGPRTDLTQHTNFGYFSDTDSDLLRRGQLHTITDTASHVTTYAGDASPYNSYTVYGEPLSVTDPNSVIADLSYDALGRLTTHTIKGVSGDPTPLTTSLTYDNAGRLTKLTRPLGNGVSYSYDVANRLTNAIRFAASTGYDQEQLVLAYDLASQLITETAQSCSPPGSSCTGVTTQTESAKYDTYGRLSEIDHPVPSGSKILLGYDTVGNLQTVQDENHSSANTTYSYDAAHRMVSMVQTLSGAPSNQITTSFGYDVQDNLNAVTDPNGNQTTYAFDDFGRARSQTSPVSGTTTYTYDADANPLTVTDANGATATSTFDALDRILTATSTRTGYTTESVSWTYDDTTSGHFGIGRLASMTDPTGSTAYTYERRGLLKTEARTILGTLYNLAYGYDYNGNRNSLTYPDSSVVNYAFDWADRPVSATGGSNTYVSAASYEPFGPIAKLVFGNGSTQTFSYDQRYRTSEDKLVNGSMTIADYLYQEDAVGNITQINDNTNAGYNRAFGYDDLNRLTTANSGSSLWGTATGNGYTYDYMGNLKTIQLGSGRTASFSYSGTTPKLTSVTENGTPRSVSYDAVGNETTVGSASYAYTPRNLLSTGDNLSYSYDGWGLRRISTTSSGSRYSFTGPDMTLLSETNVASSSPTIAYNYIWFGGRPIAQSDSTGVHYTVADHLGTPLLQTDSSNNVYWRAEHEPYGKVWALRANDVHQPLRLPGQVAEQFDTGANGLTERSYNVFRWYRPRWGRYTQVDPVGAAHSKNVYAYGSANPIALADPWGLCTVEVLYNLVTLVPTSLNPTIGVTFTPAYHSFIITVENAGNRGAPYYFRGGPGGPMFPTTDIAWGSIRTQYDPYGPNTPDWNPNWQHAAHSTIIDNGAPCKCYNERLGRAADAIGNAMIPYQPFGPNSNSTTYALIHSLGIQPPSPPVWVPGWNLGPSIQPK
ncbi:MAG: RHS repeat protein [Candidatus Eremiobacteraeota bacterium]|nr:RHS repeat protein [Candidatus Eremiobacteraeota bacterium]MBV8366140.1 RHS repeat protein [Candidatus Eremiobacteraeota bacterium]